jgi:hypothetical protein
LKSSLGVFWILVGAMIDIDLNMSSPLCTTMVPIQCTISRLQDWFKSSDGSHSNHSPCMNNGARMTNIVLLTCMKAYVFHDGLSCIAVLHWNEFYGSSEVH